ncbi:hypothetical protein B0H17DRAFT_1198168 [Mycena rosella]|uniref:Replication factor A C-terminal domain-containing protein n=1 Tax=Mycena rosella TaxID=1033263 RepID=A0AAD7DR46_MYCRO|nr:hypothetical protein B0H17DRAFT_1198168 [Mycena rosella]
MSMACADFSDQAWLQSFNDVGELVFGMTADVLHDLKMPDKAEFNNVIQHATCEQYNFSVGPKATRITNKRVASGF